MIDHRTHATIRSAALVAALLAAAPARAADTIETWDVGGTDFEQYLSVGGLGLDQEEVGVAAETVIGYGLTDAVGAYAALALDGDGFLRGAGSALAIGLFGTALDTKHVDLDLLSEVSAGGPSHTELAAFGGFELNLDLANDLAKGGLYLVVGASFYGADDPGGPTTHVDLPLTLGAYWAVAEGHQLLLQADSAALTLDSDDRALGGTSIALGYNVHLVEAVELITQVSYDLGAPMDPSAADPDPGRCYAVGDAPCGIGASIGFIATVP